MFSLRPKPKYPIHLQIMLAVDCFPEWLLANGDDSVQQFDKSESRKFIYEIRVFPTAGGVELYWHKTAGDLTNSIGASIDLSDFCPKSANWDQLYPDYGIPFVEIYRWRDQIRIDLERRRLIAIPVTEANSLMQSGYTSWNGFDPLVREINVPTANESIRDNASVISSETVIEKLYSKVVTYENKVAMIRIMSLSGHGIFKPSGP